MILDKDRVIAEMIARYLAIPADVRAENLRREQAIRDAR
jgi:hypothetical protein